MWSPPVVRGSKRRGAPRPRAFRSRCYPPDFSRCPSRPSQRVWRPRFRRGRARALAPRLLPVHWRPSRASIGERDDVGSGAPPGGPAPHRQGSCPSRRRPPRHPPASSLLSLARWPGRRAGPPGGGSVVFYRRGRQPRLLPAHPRNPVCASGVSREGGALSHLRKGPQFSGRFKAGAPKAH